MKLLLSTWILHPTTPTRFLAQELFKHQRLQHLIISQHLNRQFRHRTLLLHNQRRQLYKGEEKNMAPKLHRCQEGPEHVLQHVNHKVAVNNGRRFLHWEKSFTMSDLSTTCRYKNFVAFPFRWVSQYFSSFVFVKEKRRPILSFSSPDIDVKNGSTVPFPFQKTTKFIFETSSRI
jgi:hypothetical protein